MNNTQEIIPEFFYDFICRLIPGTILFAFILNDQRIQPLLNTTFPQVTSIIVFLLLGYVLGFIVECVSKVPLYVIEPYLIRLINKFQKKSKTWLSSCRCKKDSVESQP